MPARQARLLPSQSTIALVEVRHERYDSRIQFRTSEGRELPVAG